MGRYWKRKGKRRSLWVMGMGAPPRPRKPSIQEAKAEKKLMKGIKYPKSKKKFDDGYSDFGDLLESTPLGIFKGLFW